MTGSPDKTSRLLAEVFPDAHISDEPYLRWLYTASPFGPVVEANLDDAKGRAGHYALVPVTLTRGGRQRDGALSLNTAVHERARGGGVFVSLAEQAFAAARARGIETILGVANANSTPGFVRRLGFTLVGELPVTVLAPTQGSRGPRLVSAAAPAQHLLETAGDLLGPPAAGVARHWTPETLAWRLRAPGASYTLHRSDETLAVTTLVRHGAVRVAVILKVFAREPLSPASNRSLVRSAARWHRAPIALHAGYNDVFAPRGIPLPKRLRPSPLNLIRRELADAPESDPIVRFEFLDFDAY